MKNPFENNKKGQVIEILFAPGQDHTNIPRARTPLPKEGATARPAPAASHTADAARRAAKKTQCKEKKMAGQEMSP